MLPVHLHALLQTPRQVSPSPFLGFLLRNCHKESCIIPRNPPVPDFLQRVPCAYVDECVVAASSFRLLITALSPAFKAVDQTAGLNNLNHRKCCWVQYCSESCPSLLARVWANCEEFREMNIVNYARYVGTMIGPEGHIHRWTAPRKNSCREPKTIIESTKSLVERLCDFKI